MIEFHNRPRGPNDGDDEGDGEELFATWDDFEAMTDRVLALPPLPDEDGEGPAA